MKNYLLLIISAIILISCHIKKKNSENNTVEAIVQTSDNSKFYTNLKGIKTDSSKTIKSIIENVTHLKSIDVEFDLLQDKSTLIGNITKSNDSFLDQLSNRSSKVKIRIEHVKQNSNTQLLTQQNNIKSAIDSTVNKEKTYKQDQKIIIKEKKQALAETNTTIIYWLIAIGIILCIYFLNKLNLPTLVLRLFK